MPTSRLTQQLHSDIHVYYMQSQLEYARQLYDRIRRECMSPTALLIVVSSYNCEHSKH